MTEIEEHERICKIVMRKRATVKIIYLSWAPHCSRSDNTARELGGTSYMIYADWLGSNVFTVALKYLLQTFETLYVLFSNHPGAVYVMTPPVVAAVPVYLYAKLFRIPYVIDAHTGAFLNPRWRHFQWLQSALCRHAAATIVTNSHLSERVRAAGGVAVTVRDVPVVYEKSDDFPREEEFSVAFVTSFDIDEPIAEFLEAAGQLCDVKFYVTGDPEKLDRDLAKSAPKNVIFTGFLPSEKFGSLISGVDTVLCLTKQDHAMLRGGYEAIYQGTPVIVSDWEILRKAFDEGAVHVENTSEGIKAGISTMRKELECHQRGALSLRQRKLEEWVERKKELIEIVNTCIST